MDVNFSLGYVLRMSWCIAPLDKPISGLTLGKMNGWLCFRNTLSISSSAAFESGTLCESLAFILSAGTFQIALVKSISTGLRQPCFVGSCSSQNRKLECIGTDYIKLLKA